jgi:diacylglycerol kinase (ATP)
MIVVMKTKQFSFRARASSFRYAWEGIYRFFAQEHNTWIHLAATVAVFVAAWLLEVSHIEVILLIIVTGFVWVAEIFNTAVEKAMDLISPGYHPRVKLIKDLSAAAVLIAAIISVITGAFIFIPKIF